MKIVDFSDRKPWLKFSTSATHLVMGTGFPFPNAISRLTLIFPPTRHRKLGTHLIDTPSLTTGLHSDSSNAIGFGVLSPKPSIPPKEIFVLEKTLRWTVDLFFPRSTSLDETSKVSWIHVKVKVLNLGQTPFSHLPNYLRICLIYICVSSSDRTHTFPVFQTHNTTSSSSIK